MNMKEFSYFIDNHLQWRCQIVCVIISFFLHSLLLRIKYMYAGHTTSRISPIGYCASTPSKNLTIIGGA